eukprot:bmy_07595T0
MCPRVKAHKRLLPEEVWRAFRSPLSPDSSRPSSSRRCNSRLRNPDGIEGIVWKAVGQRTGEVVAIKKIFDAFKDKTDAQAHLEAQSQQVSGISQSTAPCDLMVQRVCRWRASVPSHPLQTRASFLLCTHAHVAVSFQRTFREIMLLQEFGDHPNIVRLLDVIRAENDRDIYLLLSLWVHQTDLHTPPDTDLNAVICKGTLLKDTHKRYIFYQLMRATKFIHSGRVIHRDQKPSNVLLDASCLVKLCDFGLAHSLSGLPEGPEGHALMEYVAMRWYRALEVLLSSSWYTPGVDMWSLGCILGEMLAGRPLFPGASTLLQLELILEAIPPPSEEDLLALGSGSGASVVQRLGSRPGQTLDALLPPDTPAEALDLRKRLLVFAPDKRLSAAQARQHPYVQRFHCPARECALEADVRPPVHEGAQISATEYRSRLYQQACLVLEHIRSQLGLLQAVPRVVLAGEGLVQCICCLGASYRVTTFVALSQSGKRDKMGQRP